MSSQRGIKKHTSPPCTFSKNDSQDYDYLVESSGEEGGEGRCKNYCAVSASGTGGDSDQVLLSDETFDVPACSVLISADIRTSNEGILKQP